MGQLLPEDSPWTYPRFSQNCIPIQGSSYYPPSLSPFTGLRPAHVLKAFPAYSCLLPLSFTRLPLSRSRLSNLVVMAAPWRTQTFKTQPLRSILLPTIAAETPWLWGCPGFCGKPLLSFICFFGAQGTFSNFLLQPRCFLQLLVLQG